MTLKCIENCRLRHPLVGVLGQMSKMFKFTLYIKMFWVTKQKNITLEPKSYTTMLLHLFFDISLSTCPKKMETQKKLEAADSLLIKKFKKLLEFEGLDRVKPINSPNIEFVL